MSKSYKIMIWQLIKFISNQLLNWENIYTMKEWEYMAITEIVPPKSQNQNCFQIVKNRI